eukprot:Hpha_TRINITY_DN30908_c0_g1::TRINITY_DN30908_c0_g1_i1::g.112311::m.112311
MQLLGRRRSLLGPIMVMSLHLLPIYASAALTETEPLDGVSLTPSLIAASISTDECDVHAEGAEVKQVDPGLVWMGTGMIIAASFLSCFAVNLQKWAINIMDQKPTSEQGSLVTQWRWLLGIVAMIAASLMDLAALPFVPLSRVAALGCSTIVANVIITPVFLGEKLTKHDLWGCGVCVTGTVLACVFGASSEPSVTTDCLVQYFLRDTFIAYAVFMLLFLSFLRWNCECYRRKRKQAINADVCSRFECVWVWANMQMVLDRTGEDEKCFPFFFTFGAQYYPGCFATLAGLCGANSVMFAKTVLICFVNLVKGQEVGSSAIYLGIFLVPFAFALYVQVGYLNHALGIYCDALFVLPVYQANWIVGGIACGMLLYQEYQSLSAFSLIMFGSGVFISLSGLALLSGRQSTGEITSRSGHRSGGGGGPVQRRTPRSLQVSGNRGEDAGEQHRRLWDLSASFLVPGGSIFLPLHSQQSADSPPRDRESPEKVSTPPPAADALLNIGERASSTGDSKSNDNSCDDAKSSDKVLSTNVSLQAVDEPAVTDPDSSVPGKSIPHNSTLTNHPCQANGDI